MSRLREEITKTFLRLVGSGRKSSFDITSETIDSRINASAASLEETIVRPAAHEKRQIGNYRIVRRLGFGGMGHVYLGLDTRLGRHVALKFLPPDLTSDRDLLYRLEDEARTASALNHPNILTIHDIGEWDGAPFIASEFVEGVTLRTLMERDAIDPGTAVDIASQIASALMSAHSAGIVHRDLKPGNIMIRPDGYVKVIDFGIAKYVGTPARRSSREPARTQSASSSQQGGLQFSGSLSDTTSPGAVVGTIAYMSPEQARGEEVDARTDLWSLGVLLYEMLARKRPFEAATDTLLVAAILNQPTPPLPDPRSLPPGMATILQRALAKQPAKRYQSAAEMLADLHGISQSSGLSSKIRPVVAQRLSRRAKFSLAAAILSILIAAWAAWWWPLGGAERVLGPNWFRIESARQITFNGRTTLASLSPDGNYLAFVAGDTGGEQTLYLKQVDSSTEEIKIPARPILYEGLTFSPDSKFIFETEKDETLLGKLYAVPILGAKSSVPAIIDIDGPVSFRPSGKQFAFVRYISSDGPGSPTESAVFLAAADGTAVRKLFSTKISGLSRRVAWSPKGDRIAAFLYSTDPHQSERTILDLIDLHGSQSLRPLPDWGAMGQASWTPDGRTLIATVSTRKEVRVQAQIRQIDLKSGRIYDLTKDVAGYSSATLSRDASELAAVKQETKAALWISSARDFTSGQTAPAEFEERPSLAWRDEQHLIVNSRRSGFPNLWLFDVGTQARTAVTNEPYVEQNAVAVPGSQSLVFSSNRAGQFHLWRFNPETNTYTQLTFGASYDATPAISPDGRWVVYTSWVSNSPHLRRVRLSGGPSEPITNYLAQSPQISPDGRRIACQIEDPVTGKWTIAVLPFDGPAEPHRFAGLQLPIRWMPTGDALATTRTDAHGVSNVWAVPLDGSAPHQLTRFEGDTILTFDWSPAGDRLACLRASSGSDVVLFTRQKNR